MMENRFKFRAWDKNNKKFWYNDDLEIDSDWGIYVSYYEKYSSCQCCGEEVSIHGEDLVVMQCTGRKDMNGKLIYEGDIYKHHDNCEPLPKYAVSWDERDSSWSVGGNMSETEDWFEVIGNIYENPELLKR
jgi:uncharacterized phage protein (TIGR01671 family)